MTKTIKISVKTHKLLSELASKNETFNDVIAFLIDYYHENEDFSDKQAEAYNRDIEKFEKEDRKNVSKLTLSELEKRITKLENEIKKWHMSYMKLETSSFRFKIRNLQWYYRRLIEVYERMYFEELSDEDADYYNERIRLFENEDYRGTRKVDLDALK